MPAPVTVYLDECVYRRTAQSLATRGISIVTAQAVNMVSVSDERQLRFSTANGWVLLSINMQDFVRLHRDFQSSGQEHAGIITIPETFSPDRLTIRAAMTLDWIAAEFPDPRNRLFRWTDLQQQLISGYVLTGYTDAEIALALGKATTLP
jgi:Domain of unknown function (DUF5615)